MLVAVLLWACASGVGDRAGSPPFSQGTFSADEDSCWETLHSPSLRMNAHYIAGPKSGEDRAAWVEALRGYRKEAREGLPLPVVRVNYQGVRAWVRMGLPLAKAYGFVPEEAVQASIEARRIGGNGELCLAFDIHDAADDRKLDWTCVCATATIPEDGDWHRIAMDCRVPSAKGNGRWLRPIVGMDATHNPAKGCVEIRDIAFGVDDPSRMTAARACAARSAAERPDRSIYDRPDFDWARRAFTCCFVFMYDRAFYDPEKGGYSLETLLRDGMEEFGGYDAIVLWQAYPRLGFDERNQFDMYRDMPGGLEGLHALTREAHGRGVKVFIDYNPWDAGTRREGKSDEEALAEMVAGIEADGIFLDTMIAGSPTLRSRVDSVRPGVVFEPEGHPAIEQLGICSASWAQWLTDPEPPGLLQLKWIEPRHMQHQIRRWNESHLEEIESAFFNGSGMLVWENVFGTYNPWRAEDRALWRRLSPILRRFAPAFTNDACEPFVPTLVEKLYANAWRDADVRVITLLNFGEPLRDAPLLDLPKSADAACYDLLTGEPARVSRDGDKIRVFGTIDRVGSVLLTKRGAVDADLSQFLEKQRALAAKHGADVRNSAQSVVEPKPVQRTPRVPAGKPPAGMVLVNGAAVRMQIEHVRRECGCYPDPGAPQERWRDFLWGSPFDGTLRHDCGPITVASFLIDEAEVSNAEFKRFIDATEYHPKHAENFLRHWPNGEMPAELADRPVVYVDLDDARAYAHWAGKRLPTEAEWHLAAQGTDGRAWPWGNSFDASKCNQTGAAMPVRSLPEGRSPCGCYHMSGNVWEWTESERDDGHTRFAMVRGGSYYQAKGSVWYADGGPRPCTHHAKFLLMWPGLDRCATIGFRCVADIE